ncbi:MAG: DegQ family serine endoprotease [Xanthomonadaceae bacterium]|nr:DegQ family serine endoprotease [Xanthomonadaceae bacterium]MDE2497500.1 DegQ family serine endoprotease [Xanthomonadaceae bacterium]
MAAVFVLLCFSGAGVGLAATPTAALPDFTSIVQKYGPAVVNVVAHYDHASEMGSDSPDQQQQTQQQQIPEIFRHFFGMPFGPQFQQPDRGGESLGSGFIISSDGYILTNRHVVANADTVKVHLSDHRTFAAKVIGTDKGYDIALLKIDATNLPTVQIGNSNALQPGQWVVAIGSPYGLDHSVSAGIVSYVGRSLGNDQQDVPFIQTDVPINRGNSGGPLFNLAGQVVGINSQIFSTDGGAMGLSFSIPINLAMNAAHQLKTKGYVRRGMLGVSVQNITDTIAKAQGLNGAQGALVAQVQPGSPAEKAGMKVGDVITAFDGHKVYDSSELPPLVAMTTPGTDANVAILRNGKPVTIKVKVGEMPRNGLSQQYLANAPAAASGSSLLGLKVQDITSSIRQQLGYNGKGGVVITDVEGPAAQANLQPGDVILRVGNQPVNNVAGFRRDTASLKPGDTVLLLVSHQGQNLFIAVSVPAK